MIYPSSGDTPLPLVLACPSEKVPSPARFHSFLPRIQPFSTQSPTTPHSNRRKVSGENPALFPRRPPPTKIGAGMPWAVFGASWHFLSKASCRWTDGRQKSQTANKTPNSRITRCFGCSAALAIVSFVHTEQPRVPAEISTFHEISVQLLLNIMRQREHFSKFFLPQNPAIPCRNDTGHLRVLAIFPN